MPTVQVEAHLSSNKILEAISQFSIEELDNFMYQLNVLRAKQIVPGLSKKETELLININEGIPDAVQSRFNHLRNRLENETISPEEHDEYLELVDQIENIDAQRVQSLMEFAQLRQISITTLMNDLGINTPPHV